MSTATWSRFTWLRLLPRRRSDNPAAAGGREGNEARLSPHALWVAHEHREPGRVARGLGDAAHRFFQVLEAGGGRDAQVVVPVASDGAEGAPGERGRAVVEKQEHLQQRRGRGARQARAEGQTWRSLKTRSGPRPRGRTKRADCGTRFWRAGRLFRSSRSALFN